MPFKGVAFVKYLKNTPLTGILLRCITTAHRRKMWSNACSLHFILMKKTAYLSKMMYNFDHTPIFCGVHCGNSYLFIDEAPILDIYLRPKIKNGDYVNNEI